MEPHKTKTTRVDKMATQLHHFIRPGAGTVFLDDEHLRDIVGISGCVVKVSTDIIKNVTKRRRLDVRKTESVYPRWTGYQFNYLNIL